MGKDLEYDFADKAWQVVVGCDNTIPCWRACWAKRTVARLAGSPNAKTAAAHAGLVQMSGPTKEILTWTGDVRINEAHLNDPLKWRDGAIVATGFHGDWGLLSAEDKRRMFSVMHTCQSARPGHRFFPLTKHNLSGIVEFVGGMEPLPNVNIGVSVMTQADATATLPYIRRIAEMGWKTHCWHEPSIGPVDWRGWEFLTWLVVGGQSAGSEPFDLQWARNAIKWGWKNKVPVKIKQLGSHPVMAVSGVDPCHTIAYPTVPLKLKSRRGSDPSEWPEDLMVKEMPESQGVRERP